MSKISKNHFFTAVLWYLLTIVIKLDQIRNELAFANNKLADNDKDDEFTPMPTTSANDDVVQIYTPPQTAPEPITEPDWTKAPKWAEWWARDDDGKAWWHTYKPAQYTRDGIWQSDKNAGLDSYYNAKFDVLPKHDWQKSLRQRPRIEGIKPDGVWIDEAEMISKPQIETLTVKLNADTDGYLAGKTSFISAYVDLLLARMAKEERFSDDDCVGEFPAPVAGDICLLDDDSGRFFCIVFGNEERAGLTRLFTVVIGNRKNSLAFKYFSDDDFKPTTNTILRTITELEAVEFRQAMETVYG